MSLLDVLPPGTWSPPPTDAAAKIASLEERLGRPLPPDLAALHHHAQSVSLGGGRYRFLAPDAMRPIAKLQAGDANATWYATLGPESGSVCTAHGCTRLRVAHSVKCRRHHYEMVHRRPSPFTDE